MNHYLFYPIKFLDDRTIKYMLDFSWKERRSFSPEFRIIIKKSTLKEQKRSTRIPFDGD